MGEASNANLTTEGLLLSEANFWGFLPQPQLIGIVLAFGTFYFGTEWALQPLQPI